MVPTLTTHFSDLQKYIEDYAIHKLFIVCRPGSYEKSGAKIKAEALLRDMGVRFHYFHGFELNPKYENIMDGVQAFKQSLCNGILAVGGGSALDTAKAIAIFSSSENVLSDYLASDSSLTENTIPLIAVPTTAGTGSEATRYSIIYYNEVKYTITHSSIRPWAVILESSFLLSLPQYVLAETMMDAYAQAIESYWSVGSTPQAKDYAAEAIQLIDNHFEAALGKDLTALGALLRASNLAGEAIEITKTTAPHAMAYGLTTHYGIPHGHAVGLLLPEAYRLNADPDAEVNDPRGREYLNETFRRLNAIMKVESAEAAVQKLYNRLEQLKLLIKIEGLDIDMLVGKVALDRLGNNPVVYHKKTLTAIYQTLKK